MDREKIDQIRREFSIPLAYAIKLLKENQNDVSAAIVGYHKDNIQKITQATDCQISVAQEVYQHCNFNVEKSIKKIKSQVMLLTTRKDQQIIKNEIGFILWAESEGKKINSNDIFIPVQDFDCILKVFQAVSASNLQSSFDMCGENYFDHETSLCILNEIKKIQMNNSQINNFLGLVITWWNEQLSDAEFIVVYGNL
ncbi:hypothetical protein [Acinetobacter junii]|uniref:hypothetical protein n=1 Tax=Acinetobacter junii TaxID=40215 RepID=UPI003215A88F